MREAYEFKLASGTALRLRYPFKALRHFETLTGQHFFGDSARGNIGADYLSAGFAAGLLHEQPSIKVEQTDALIEAHLEAGGDLPSLVEHLMKALQRSGVLKDPTVAEQPDRPSPPPAVVAS